ncbi:MAG: type II toxin-antitoxin system HicA family toxin [Acidobacteria bacterium]|nr:type II toxin-antitoxin system HicA family toxin [Acidobacteriota bacterium]
MNGKEFVDRVTALGRRRGVPVRVDAKRGRGSHVMLYYGDRKTVVKDRRKELGPGLLAAMTRQLGLDSADLR